jgi:hypothetical protein
MNTFSKVRLVGVRRTAATATRLARSKQATIETAIAQPDARPSVFQFGFTLAAVP